MNVFKTLMLLAFAFIVVDIFASYLFGENIETFRYVFVFLISLFVFSLASYLCKVKYEVSKDGVYRNSEFTWLNGKKLVDIKEPVDIENTILFVRVKQKGKRDVEFIKAFFNKADLTKFISELDRLTNRST